MVWTAPVQVSAGETATVAIQNAQVIDNLVFLGATHDHTGDSGDGANVRRSAFYYPVHAIGGNTLHGLMVSETDVAAATLDNGSTDELIFNIIIPTTFSSLSKAVMLIKALESANMRRVAQISTLPSGGSTTQETASTVTRTLSSDVLFHDDVSGAFTNLAAGDLVGLNYSRLGATDPPDTLTVSVFVAGLWLEWT